MNESVVWQAIKGDVEREISGFLKAQFDSGTVDQLIYEKAISDVGVFANLNRWMESPDIDRISPNAKRGILSALFANRWPDINECFFTEVEFGTGGIRGRAVISDWELELLRDEGIAAPFLRGPNTINDVVLLQKSAAIAKFANMRGFKSLVIGFDSRIRGRDFAKIIAELFIDYGLKVYLFDDVVPYPEVTFAIPTMHADMGILLSASHNDRRYNGYKLSCGNGSQFSVAERRMILNDYIGKTGFDEIRRADLATANNDQLVFLGGAKRVKDINYYSYVGEPVNIHKQHEKQIASFLLDKKLLKKEAKKIHLGYCAYNGAGRDAVPRLIKSLDIKKLDCISSMQPVDGMFPAFDDLKSPKGKKVYQQPDPGDKFAALKAVSEFVKEYGKEKFGKLDALIGTDPDADRVGVVVPVPKSQRPIYNGEDNVLLDADTAWAILLWYRMEKMKHAKSDFSKFFLVQSHTTTDVITLLCEKYGIAWIKTWVGFAQLVHCRPAQSGMATRSPRTFTGRFTTTRDSPRNQPSISPLSNSRTASAFSVASPRMRCRWAPTATSATRTAFSPRYCSLKSSPTPRRRRNQSSIWSTRSFISIRQSALSAPATVRRRCSASTKASRAAPPK